MRPDVQLQAIPGGERDLLAAMMAPYLQEHAAFVDPEGRLGPIGQYPYLDLYWTEPGREPFWIVADGERVGFTLINRHSPSGLGCDAAIAEFGLAVERRRQGLGAAAALAALARRQGVWELQVYEANAPAMAFWPRVIEGTRPLAWEQILQPRLVIHRFSTG